MIARTIDKLILDDIFFELDGFLPNAQSYAKLEHFNMAGSIKIKTALQLIRHCEGQGLLKRGESEIVESSSGNLGVALSILSKRLGYDFVCVVDSNSNIESRELITLFGGKVEVITEIDKNGGYLQGRINRVNELLHEKPNRVWLNQYSSRGNMDAHYLMTAPSIFSEFKCVDYLFVGCGTGGTLMGCAQYIKHHDLPTKIIAIDTVGSVSFGGRASTRYIPGLGTSVKPPILDADLVDDLVMIEENETVAMCREVALKYGLCLGGSSGTVLSGMRKYAHTLTSDKICIAIMPDGGSGYLNTVYDKKWTAQRGLD